MGRHQAGPGSGEFNERKKVKVKNVSHQRTLCSTAPAVAAQLVENTLERNPVVAIGAHLAGLLLRLLPRRRSHGRPAEFRAAPGQTKGSSKVAKGPSGENQGETKGNPRCIQGKTKAAPGENQGGLRAPSETKGKPLVEVCSRVRLSREGVRHA
jgi:hypothetical protein